MVTLAVLLPENSLKLLPEMILSKSFHCRIPLPTFLFLVSWQFLHVSDDTFHTPKPFGRRVLPLGMPREL